MFPKTLFYPLWVLPLLSMLYLFACEGRSNAVNPKAEPAELSSQARTPDEVLPKLLKLAASTTPPEQKQLLEFLSSKDSLYQLDPREDHIRMPVLKLRLAQVYQAIKANNSAAMRDTLTTLARSGKPENCDACDTLLINALAMVRPATPEVVKFWETHSSPDSIQLKFTIDALCENGSAPAVALLEKRLLNAQIEPEQKIAWMHEAILQHRRNASLLAGLDRILTTTLPKALRPPLVESLFDYRPNEWFRNDRNPPAPDTQPLTPEAKRLLQKIGATALKKVALNANQRRAVTKSLAELK